MLNTHTEQPSVFLPFDDAQAVRLIPICGFRDARKGTICCTDAHVGKGVSIGTVFASEKYVAPMAVGVDIGMRLSCVSTHALSLHLSSLQPSVSLCKSLMVI